MFAMTISQLFNDDVLKRASIVSICQFASLSLVSLKETPLHINTKVNVLFRILIRVDFLKIHFFPTLDQSQSNVGFPPKLLNKFSLSDGLRQRLFSFLSSAARIDRTHNYAAPMFLETKIKSFFLNKFSLSDLMFVSRNGAAAQWRA